MDGESVCTADMSEIEMLLVHELAATQKHFLKTKVLAWAYANTWGLVSYGLL